MKATWQGQLLAESDRTIVVEGNHYFPPDSLNMAFFERSQQKTVCPFKGEASYYSVIVDGQKNENSAWYYPHVREGFKNIKGYVAFWRGIKVSN